MPLASTFLERSLLLPKIQQIRVLLVISILTFLGLICPAAGLSAVYAGAKMGLPWLAWQPLLYLKPLYCYLCKGRTIAAHCCWTNTTASSEIQSCRCISNVVREEPCCPSWSCHLILCLLTQIDCTFLKFLPLMVALSKQLCPGACHFLVLTSLQVSDIPLLCSSWWARALSWYWSIHRGYTFYSSIGDAPTSCTLGLKRLKES